MRRDRLVYIAPMISSVLALGALAHISLSKPKATDLPAPPGALDPRSSVANASVPATLAAPPSFARTVHAQVSAGYTMSQTLKDFGLLFPERAALMEALKPLADAAHVAAGTGLKAYYRHSEDEAPVRVEVRLGDRLTVELDQVAAHQWVAKAAQVPIETRLAAFSGVVRSNLWSSAVQAGMDPQLINRMAELFAYQVDFRRGVHEDDKWRLTVERLFIGGKPAGWGDVVAAEYVNDGESYAAVRYNQGGVKGYFSPDGGSLRRLFLKSPLRYAHITSGFQAARFHPILKVRRPHLGIDYGAPQGTEVMAVGDGIITFAGNRGGSGNMIRIKHSGTYATEYKHLSAFATGLSAGAKVSTGQVIGFVGATGLATGPHLHFEFHVAGQVVDPQGLRFPAADPVPEKEVAAFRIAAKKALDELPPWSALVVTEANVSDRALPN